MNATSKRNQVGFTLIELLVVIAIIAILAAILFPVFAKVREKARQTSCLSNEKQLGLAVIQYVQDYDEKFPAGGKLGLSAGCYGFAGGNVDGEAWAYQLYPYVKSTGAYICPDDSTNTQFGVVSYAYNSNLPGNGDAALAAPASTVVLFESLGGPQKAQGEDPSQSLAGVTGDCYVSSNDPDYDSGSGGQDYYTGGPTGNWDPAVGIMGARGNDPNTERHTGGANFLAADGHAKWLRPSAVSDGFNPSTTNQYQDQGGTPQAATTDSMYLNSSKTTQASLTFSLL